VLKIIYMKKDSAYLAGAAAVKTAIATRVCNPKKPKNIIRDQHQQKRIEIVNLIIKEISYRGRRFFHYEGQVAYIYKDGNKIWMRKEYLNKRDVCLSVKYPPRNWHHGGTLWALTMDFKEYIQKGGDTNHKNGYGGLYCPHWGYAEEDMIIIQELAKELGYLK
jgi:hypothetical protein